MTALYRNRHLLPSLLLASLASGCDQAAPPVDQTVKPVPNVDREALQEAEALKHTVEPRDLEHQRIYQLIGRGQARTPNR